MKLYRVIARRPRETEEPVPADLKRRQKQGIYIENGISVWRSDKVSSYQSILKVKLGRKAKNNYRYGVLSCEVQSLLSMGYHVKLDKEHVNIRCPDCDMATLLDICKSTKTACALDLGNSFEHLLVLLRDFKTVIPVPKTSNKRTN